MDHTSCLLVSHCDVTIGSTEMETTLPDGPIRKSFGAANIPLFHEMLRSFVTLAATLNLSEAVRLTASTRQTLRRHIATLEEMRGEKLFSLDDRRYYLTNAGARALQGAEDILARSAAWLSNEMGHIGGLVHISGRSPLGVDYFLQHHPLGKLWTGGEPMLQAAFKGWSDSKGMIEDDHFAQVRPFAIIFRPVTDAWVCVEVGKLSSYASWYGESWARSTIGLAATDLPAGLGFGRLLSIPFEEVTATESARFDHISTAMIREKNGKPVPISYQRLLLGIRFPNGSAGIASIVERTYNIEIAGVSSDFIMQMPPTLVMNSNVVSL